MARRGQGAARRTGRRAGRRAGRGALGVIVLLLVASAGLRVALGTGEAMAREAAETAESPSGVEDSTRAGPETACEVPEDMAALLSALQERKARLDAREAEIGARLQALNVADREIDRKMQALVAAEEELRATLALADEAAEGDLTRLTAVYENMKPKQAAALFEQMDPQFAAGFLGRMRPDAAAEVMAGLDPQTAYAISVILAGRNANAPTE